MTNKLYQLMNWPKIEEVIYSDCDCPHDLLGMHKAGTHDLLQAYFPGAASVSVIWTKNGEKNKMELADEDGFFALLVPAGKKSDYQYEVSYPDGKTVRKKDAYRHKPLLTEEDLEKWKHGIHYTIYEKMGAHPMKLDGEEGTYFALWAPDALRVSTVGDFNQWDGRLHQMRRLGDSGIFEIFIPDAMPGQNYKFELKYRNGLTRLIADPYANACQLRPDTASVITDLTGFFWEDAEFLEKREGMQKVSSPVSICEIYPALFASDAQINFRTLAGEIISYIEETGYTHIELLPIMEYFADESFGYATTGYYAPTARYGTPVDFMYFINELHKSGIGVILDWFPVRGAVKCPQKDNFYIANALFWVEKYHVDGIKMTGVSDTIYLDYGKKDGEWSPNIYGGNENLEGIEMIRHLNSILKKRNLGVLSIAEEKCAFPKVTDSLEDGGLGFDSKWNNGFSQDYLDYIKLDPYFRSGSHNKLTLSMIYAYSEKFVLAFSHDVVGIEADKLLREMPDAVFGMEEKLSNLRLTYAFLMMHPGRKLFFERKLPQTPDERKMAALIHDLNALYRNCPALHRWDDLPSGFEWISSIRGEEGILSFLRKGSHPEDTLLVVANFSGVSGSFSIGVPWEGRYKELLNTDQPQYGGSGLFLNEVKKTEDRQADGRPVSVTIDLAPLSLAVFQYEPDIPEREVTDCV